MKNILTIALICVLVLAACEVQQATDKVTLPNDLGTPTNTTTATPPANGVNQTGSETTKPIPSNETKGNGTSVQPNPDTKPTTCQDTYATCSDGYQYKTAKCADGKLNQILYVSAPCTNHEKVLNQTKYCTEDKNCVRQASCCDCGLGDWVNQKYYKEAVCQYACKCALFLSEGKCVDHQCVGVAPNGCTADEYATCADGTSYKSATCTNGTLTKVEYFRDPCTPVEPITCTPESKKQIACTMDWNPVCGAYDNGIRCIKAPCPNIGYKTYGNACSACADPAVFEYTKGECANETKGGFQ